MLSSFDKYHDVFELIPHIGRLPNNVTTRIRLKDAEKISSRTYSYPQSIRKLGKH
jgi:hypothetical protein